MNRASIILLLCVHALFFSCKEIPTFQGSTYPIQRIDNFQVIKDINAQKAVFFVKYTSQFPYDGFEVQVRNSKNNDDFDFYSIIEKESATNDSLFYIDLETIPYRYNEFQIRAFHNSDDGIEYSDSEFAHLNQHVYNFRESGISTDSTFVQIYWNHNFVSPYDIHFHIQGKDGNERTFSSTLQTSHTNGFFGFDSDTVGFEPTTEISYSVVKRGEEISNSTERHPLFVQVVDCLEKRDGFYLMSFEDGYLSYNYSAREIEYGWNSQCLMDEVQIIRDDGGRYRIDNKPWAHEIVASRENTTGPIATILSPNEISSYTQIWFRAKTDSIYTELTIPFIIERL